MGASWWRRRGSKAAAAAVRRKPVRWLPLQRRRLRRRQERLLRRRRLERHGEESDPGAAGRLWPVRRNSGGSGPFGGVQQDSAATDGAGRDARAARDLRDLQRRVRPVEMAATQEAVPVAAWWRLWPAVRPNHAEARRFQAFGSGGRRRARGGGLGTGGVCCGRVLGYTAKGASRDRPRGRSGRLNL